jgi:hypothetical protein
MSTSNELERWLQVAPSHRVRRAMRGVYNLLSDDIDAVFPVNPSGGADYYVDGNVTTGGTGESWDSPCKTLAAAILLSNASITRSANRWWARRNRIFVVADRLVETIVLFPTKCDIIGVGSCDALLKPGIRGNHAPVTTEYYGTRWINVHFEPATAADIITLTNAGSGTEFHYCDFIGIDFAITAVSGIDSTAHELLKVMNCEFQGGFSADYIDIGDGKINGTRIMDNIMTGGAKDGVMVTGTATLTSFASRGHIANNHIQCANITISAGVTSVFNVVNNYLMTAGAFGATSHVIDLSFAVNNRLSAADAFSYIPPEPVY